MSRRTSGYWRRSLSSTKRPYGQWIWNASSFFIIESFSLSRKVRTRSNLVLSSSVLQTELHARSRRPDLKVSRHELMEKSWVCKENLNKSRKINTSYFVPKVARDNLCWLWVFGNVPVEFSIHCPYGRFIEGLLTRGSAANIRSSAYSYVSTHARY